MSGDRGSTDDVVFATVVEPPSRNPFDRMEEEFLRGEQSPVGWREWLAVPLLVALCDITIYNSHGLAGYALLFATAPLLLLFGSYRPRWGWGLPLTGAMLLALAARMMWLGEIWHVALGFGLLAAFAMCLLGLRPYVLELFLFVSQIIVAGYAGLVHYARSLKQTGVPVSRVRWLSFLLPLGAFVLFSLLFVLANPDLLSSFGRRFERISTAFREWFLSWSPEPGEVLFWCAAFWIIVGLLRPVVRRALQESIAAERADGRSEKSLPVECVLYVAFRNTLLTVIVLFAAYLAFEFKTLWFRVFPIGFYYAGYAHQGAAWLTVALALSTAILSFVFRGRVLHDPRLPRLRKLTWIWSLENIVLAVAVYHRMLIYVRFNGMTQMRMIGLFGMTLVVAGFILVLWKIAHNRSFLWLIRRQLWAMALTFYLYALTPVDAIVFRYNVRCVMTGELAPSVQISVQTINSEGLVLLEPLLDCNDPIIREGIRALLAERHAEAERLDKRRKKLGWTAYQMADRRALLRMRASSHRWAAYTDTSKQRETLERFHDYVYHQWY